MKLNKENLHGARYIGKWLSLLLRFELCGHVWLVFFCIVFQVLVMMWQWNSKYSTNMKQEKEHLPLLALDHIKELMREPANTEASLIKIWSH